MLALLLILVLSGIGALISLSEIAFAAARETRLRLLAEGGEPRAARFLLLRQNPAPVVTALQIVVNALGVAGGVLGEGALTPVLAPALTPVLERLGAGEWAMSAASALSFVTVTTLFILLSDLVPKRVAMAYPERVAVLTGWFPALSVRLFRPLVWLFSGLADGLMRLFGLPTGAVPETVTPEELRATLAAGAESGALDAAEHRLIENVLALRERSVTSAMTPRDEIVFLDLKETPEAWREKVRRKPYSRYPVCEGGLDHVVGYTRAEDVLAEVLQAGVAALKPESLKPNAPAPGPMRRDVPSVPETLDLWEVLAQFEAQKAGFALVVSEYAVVTGLVTYKDVLAALVGGLADPFEERAILQRDADSWLVDGIAPLADVAVALGTEDLPLDGPYHTAGGFVMHKLRRVPRKADKVEAAGFVFEVMDVEGFRVNQLLVIRKNHA
nr:hemolysin family protein [Roseomonas sp. GC11]